jgi:hypothetical protein
MYPPIASSRWILHESVLVAGFSYQSSKRLFQMKLVLTLLQYTRCWCDGRKSGIEIHDFRCSASRITCIHNLLNRTTTLLRRNWQIQTLSQDCLTYRRVMNSKRRIPICWLCWVSSTGRWESDAQLQVNERHCFLALRRKQSTYVASREIACAVYKGRAQLVATPRDGSRSLLVAASCALLTSG